MVRLKKKGMDMVYSWKTFQYSVSADVAGKEFEKIEKEYGKVTSELLLQNAEPEESPLHGLFEWDDAVAGHKYRLSQATNVIINLAVEVEKEQTPKKIRAYYNVSEDEKRGKFINVESAFSNPDTAEIIIKRAYKELVAFTKKYENLKEFAPVFKAIEDLKESILGEEEENE